MDHLSAMLEQFPQKEQYIPLFPIESIYPPLKFSEQDGFYGDRYDNEVILLAGDPGSGKTVFLKNVLEKLSKDVGYFPLYLDLNQESYEPEMITLFDVIIFILNRLSSSLSWEQIEPDQKVLRQFYLWYQKVAMEINTNNDIEIKLPVALKGRIDLEQLVVLFQKLKLFLQGTSLLRKRMRDHFLLYRESLLFQTALFLKGIEAQIEQAHSGGALLVVIDHFDKLPFPLQKQLIPLLKELNVTLMIPVHGVISSMLPPNSVITCWLSSGGFTPGFPEQLTQILRRKFSTEQLSDQLLDEMISCSGGNIGQLMLFLEQTLRYSGGEAFTEVGFRQTVQQIRSRVVSLTKEEQVLLQTLDPDRPFLLNLEHLPLMSRGIVLQPEPMHGMLNPLYRYDYR